MGIECPLSVKVALLLARKTASRVDEIARLKKESFSLTPEEVIVDFADRTKKSQGKPLLLEKRKKTEARQEDIDTLERASIIERCTKEQIVTVVEEEKKRRRPIYWPKALNKAVEDQMQVEIQDPIEHARIDKGVWAATFDIKASFFPQHEQFWTHFTKKGILYSLRSARRWTAHKNPDGRSEFLVKLKTVGRRSGGLGETFHECFVFFLRFVPPFFQSAVFHQVFRLKKPDHFGCFVIDLARWFP